MKVKECWRRYLGEYALANLVDVERQQYAWERLKRSFAEKDHTEVTPRQVRDYIHRRVTKDKVGNATVNRELGTLSAVLRWSWKVQYIDRVPYIQRISAPAPRERVLSDAEVVRILAEAERNVMVWGFFMIGLHTAQRKGAILDLTWDRVDLVNGVVDFRNPALAHPGRRKGRAVVPMNDELAMTLRLLKPHENGPLVLHTKSGRPITSIYDMVGPVLKRAGLTDVTPHTIRHTVATVLTRKGRPIQEVQQLLAHKSISTTERVYVKYTPDYLKGAVGNLKWGSDGFN